MAAAAEVASAAEVGAAAGVAAAAAAEAEAAATAEAAVPWRSQSMTLFLVGALLTFVLVPQFPF